jgi:hypothetical protein
MRTRRQGDTEKPPGSRGDKWGNMTAVADTSERFPASPRRRVSASVFRWFVLISRFGLAAMFLFAAGAKLAVLRKFVVNVAELLTSASINYQRWQWPVTIAVICAELGAATLLLWPRTIRLGGIWSALLLIVFSGFALYYVYVLHGEPLECGCFGGIIASQLGVKTALRNLVLLIPALIVIFDPSRATKVATPAQTS